MSDRQRCACGRYVGRISWPEDLSAGGGAHASTYVCAHPEDREEASRWVESVTGHRGVFVEFAHASRVPGQSGTTPEQDGTIRNDPERSGTGEKG